MRGDLRPADLLNGTVLAALGGATLVTWEMNPQGSALLVTYGALAAFLGLSLFLDRRGLPFGRPLHALYSIGFIPVIFDSLADLVPIVSPGHQDALLIRWERWLFGTDLSVWCVGLYHPVLTELLTWAYMAYYFLPIILAIVLYLRGPRADLDRMVSGVLLGFYLSFLGYFLVPAVGPRFTLAAEYPEPLGSVFVGETIRLTLDSLERFKQDAFPSGHTAVVLLVLFYSYRSVRGLFWAFLPVVLALILSTVYLRYHYGVDVIAGAILATLCPPLEVALTRWFASQTAPS